MVETKRAMYRNGVEYTIPGHVQFIEDMDRAGLPVELRMVFGGGMPSVRVKTRENALKHTNVGCDWCVAGRDMIVFPYHVDGRLKDQQKYSWGY